MPLGILVLLVWVVAVGAVTAQAVGLKVDADFADDFRWIPVVALGMGVEALRRLVAFPILGRLVGFHLSIPVIDGAWEYFLHDWLGMNIAKRSGRRQVAQQETDDPRN